MKKIYFICHGNICRSTMAQCVMQNLIEKNHLENKYIIDSFATSDEEIGNPIHYGTRKKLKEKGIPIIEHRAKRIHIKDVEEADYIIGMDDENIRNLKNMFPQINHDKLSKLLDYTDKKENIADPWYTGNFDKTFNDVLKGCKGLLEVIK